MSDVRGNWECEYICTCLQGKEEVRSVYVYLPVYPGQVCGDRQVLCSGCHIGGLSLQTCPRAR